METTAARLQKTLGHQARQGLAHRRAAHAQAGGEFDLARRSSGLSWQLMAISRKVCSTPLPRSRRIREIGAFMGPDCASGRDSI
jgi:hypothetical protein